MSEQKKKEMIEAVELAVKEFDDLFKELERVLLFKDYIKEDRNKAIYYHTLQSNLFEAKKKLIFCNAKLDRATQLVMEFNVDKLLE